MHVVTSFDEIPQNLKTPIAVTIGTFDGIHLGHQTLLKRLKELAQTTAVVTFSNHPSEILNPTASIPLIYPPEKKLQILESYGIDLIVLLTFTKDTSSYTYDRFLLDLRDKLPFDYLVLGWDACLGKGRTGTPEAIQAFAKGHGFSVEYMPKYENDGAAVSSGRIRQLIAENKLEKASRLLGRIYKKLF